MTPVHTLGIVGTGQLARMLALAARPLGIRCVFLDLGGESCVEALGETLAYDGSADSLQQFLARVDRVTFEREHVDPALLAQLADNDHVRPRPAAITQAQHRAREKHLFQELAIPTAPFVLCESTEQLVATADTLGLPLIVKRLEGGYDGRGQWRLDSREALAELGAELQGEAVLAEGLVQFDRELSIIAARGADGDVRCYPLTENHHRDGILRHSLAPAPDLPGAWQRQAADYVSRLLDALDYVGVICLELFATADGLLANEYAPRVHNSGHWTIEGAATSQFENQVRAVCDLPLGEVTVRGHAAMVNLLGALPDRDTLLAMPSLYWHDYEKTPRPGRKLGHVTLLDDELASQQLRLRKVLSWVDAAPKASTAA